MKGLGDSGMGDSPLVTPRQDPDDEDLPRQANPSSSLAPPSLMSQLESAILNPTAVRAKPDAQEDTKKRGWQERLENLKKKKAADKALQKQ